MPPRDGDLWTDVGERVARADLLALFLDFDGTLSPIVAEPDRARMDPTIRRVLRSFAQRPGVRVAVLSGRALADLEKRVAVRGLYLAGSHGLEISGPTIRFTQPAAIRKVDAKAVLAWRLASALAAIPGVVVEEKPYSVACHFRQAPPSAVGPINRRIREILAELNGDWRTIRGRRVVELLPVRDWTKGSCASLLLEHYRATSLAGASILSIAIGDDRTDEDLFRAIAPHGVSIGVGRRSTLQADHRLAGVAEVRQFLAWLLSRMPLPVRAAL